MIKKIIGLICLHGLLSVTVISNAFAVEIINHATKTVSGSQQSQNIRFKIYDDTGYKNYALTEQLLNYNEAFSQDNFPVSDDVWFVHVDHDYAPSRINVVLAESGTASYGPIRHINNSGCVITVNSVSDDGTYSADIGPGC